MLRVGLIAILAFVALSVEVRAQERQVVNLSVEETVDRALRNSYRVRQLEMSVEQTRSWLRAERAGLRSRVYMNLAAPEFDAISDNKWNSDLQRYELVRENNRLWQMDFTIEQPVVLLGYPTNGYLSLNNRMYRYTQLNGGRDVTYYNRYFVRYRQPFFQPNELRINLERAEMNFRDSEFQFREDIINVIDDAVDDYFDLLEIAYQEQIYGEQVELLRRAVLVASELAAADTAHALDVSQIEVELANRDEQLKQARSSYRLEASQLARRLRLEAGDSILVVPELVVTPVVIDEEQARHYGMTLRPQLQRLEIRRRRDELDVKQAKGWDSFRMSLEVTYGRETQDPRFQALWDRPTNSYTVGMHAYVPIWDWGRRRARIQAEQISLERSELYMEEVEEEIEVQISNFVQNVREYQERALSMQDNLGRARSLSESSLQLYRAERIGVLDLLQTIRRQEDTAQNFLRAYMGYRGAIRSLQDYTHYDYERNMPLLERFGVELRRGS